jgi:hypothetical protein
MRAAGVQNSGVIQTCGELFPDGTVLELFRAPSELGQVNLLRWNGSVLEVAAHVEHAGRRYSPVAIDPYVKTALRLPTRVAPPETTRALFAALYDILASYLAQVDSCLTAMVFAIFVSWFSPVLPMAPIISIYAPAGTPKNLVLQLLSLFCRRPLRLIGLRRGDLLRVPMSLRPTLLLDEPDLKPAMEAILLSSSQRGTHIPSGRGMQDLFGPKIICSRNPPHNQALETDVLRVSLIPVSGQLPSLDQKAEEAIVEEFQSRFLGYYLRNCSGLRVPNFDVSDLALPMQALARALGAAVVGDEELQAKILPLLKVQDEEIRADRASALDSVVLEAILFFIHQSGWTTVRVRSIAERVSAINKGRGFYDEPSPERVGWAIRRLGIPSGRIDRASNGIALNASTCRLVHKLAMSHGVRAMQGELHTECQYCNEIKTSMVQAKT